MKKTTKKKSVNISDSDLRRTSPHTTLTRPNSSARLTRWTLSLFLVACMA